MSIPEQSVPTPGEIDRRSYRPAAAVIAIGIFVTTFVQLQGLGSLPINALLMKKMNLDSNEAGTFVALCTLPWTFKAVAGLLIDGVPLFGSKRRSYLMLSAVFAMVMWGLMAVFSAHYVALLICAMGMNTALVFAGTTAGGLLVETAQKYSASGRLSSMRTFAQSLGAALGVPVGGLLAGYAFGWTSLAAAVPLSCLFLAAWFLLRDDRIPAVPASGKPWWRRALDVAVSIWRQIRNVLTRPMLVPALLFFVIQGVPTFRSTSFYEYQTKSLGFPDATLGMLSLAGYGAALLSPFCYAWFCRRVSLRTSLYGAVVLSSLSALPYLAYPAWDGGRHLPLILAIEGVATFLMILAYVPLFDLAARVTPKGSEALGYAVLLSVWNIGLMVSGKAGPWIYQTGVDRALAKASDPTNAAVQFAVRHQEMNQLIWLNALGVMGALVLVWLIPRAVAGAKDS